MARIRSIKPEFWADEKLSLLDPITRLVFLGLVSMADDAGRLVDNVKLLDGQLFPNTDDTCRESLDILARLSRISRYTSESGQKLIQIVNWERHQKVDHPNKYVLPAPAAEPVAAAAVVEPSREPRESLAKSSRNPRDTTYDLGPTTNDQRPTTVSRADAREPSDDRAELFARAWAAYPRRSGANPRRDAEQAWHARLREGVAADAMLAGVQRYAVWCESGGKLGTEFVMQAKRFFGPSRHFDESWEPAAEPEDDTPEDRRLRALHAEQRRKSAEDEAWLFERMQRQGKLPAEATLADVYPDAAAFLARDRHSAMVTT